MSYSNLALNLDQEYQLAEKRKNVKVEDDPVVWLKVGKE